MAKYFNIGKTVCYIAFADLAHQLLYYSQTRLKCVFISKDVT